MKNPHRRRLEGKSGASLCRQRRRQGHMLREFKKDLQWNGMDSNVSHSGL